MYRPAILAESNGTYDVLYVDFSDPDCARLEPLAFHLVATEEYAERGRSATVRAVWVPVPLSFASNSNTLDDMAERFIGRDVFYELRRTGDIDSAVARLNSAFECGLTCAWHVQDDRADVGVTLARRHGEDCKLSYEDDDQNVGYELRALPGGAS